MKNTIKFYLERGQIIKDADAKSLSNGYLKKAKNNLTTAKILSEIQKSEKARSILKIPKEHDANEWIVITGYYAMYSAALALLAKIGFKSKNHTATFLVLEEYFVKNKHLDEKDLLLIKNAQFQKEELEQISEARHKREIAQYSVTKQTTKNIADKIQKEAYEFVNKVQEIL